MASIDILIRVKDAASAALQQTLQGFRQLRQTVEATALQMREAGLQLTLLGGAFAALPAIPIKVAASFEQAVSNIKASFANLTPKEITELQDAAIKQSQVTKFSANEAAASLRELALAGFSVEESIKALPIVLNVAAAGNLQLADAAIKVADTIRQFGLSINEFGRAGDVLVRASQLSTTNIEGLSEAMKFAGPVANTLGISLEEVATTFAIFSNNGLKGSIAGTNLRAILAGLTSTANEDVAVMERLGISVKDTSGNFVGLQNVFSQLAHALDDLGSADKVAVFDQLFGRRGATGSVALLKSFSDSSKVFDDLLAKIKDSGGAAEKAAKTQIDNVIGAFGILKSAIGALLIQIGQPFLDTIKSVVLAAVSMVSQIKAWVKENQGLTTVILTVVGSVGILITSVGGLSLVIGTLGLAISAVVKGFAAWSLIMPVVSKGISGLITLLGRLTIAATVLVGILALFSPEFRDYIGNLEFFGLKIKEIVNLGIIYWQKLFTTLRIKWEELFALVKNVLLLGEADLSENAKKIAQLQQELVTLDKEEASLQRQITLRVAAKTVQEQLNTTQRESVKINKELEADLKEIAELAKKIDQPSKPSFTAVDLKSDESRLSLVLEKNKTQLLEIQRQVEQGNLTIQAVYKKRREIIEQETQKEIEALKRQAIEDPTKHNELDNDVAIVFEKQRQKTLELENEETKAQERIKEKREEIEKLIKKARLDAIDETHLSTLQKLDAEHQKAMENLRIRQQEEREALGKNLVETGGGGKDKVDELEALQVKQRLNLEAEQKKQRLKLEAELNLALEQARAATLERISGTLEAARDREIINLRIKHNEEIEEYRRLGASEIELAELVATQKEEIVKRKKEFELQALEEVFNHSKTLAAGTADIFSDLYELSGKQVKEFFLLSKGAAIAQATLNIAEGITKALATGGFFGIAQGALVAAAGTVQIAKIVASTIKGFAKGGPVLGGSGARDDVPALLTAGEYVMPRSTVRYYGAEFFESLRQGLLPKGVLANLSNNLPRNIYTPAIPKFATGGLVSPVKSQETKQPVNIVNFVDKQIVEQYLASTAGNRTIVNAIGRNAQEIKKVLFV